MGYGPAVVVVAMGRSYCPTRGSRRDATADSSTEMARRLLQRDDARPAVEKFGSYTATFGTPPHGEAVDTRWEDPIKETCNACTPVFTSWQSLAQDKSAWDAMEMSFVQKHIRVVSEHAFVPRGRWMIGETPP